MRAGSKEVWAMEMLDKNELDDGSPQCISLWQCDALASLRCGWLEQAREFFRKCGDQLRHGCWLVWCPQFCPADRCVPGGFMLKLTENLKACGDGFYIKCPGFERMEKYCEFEPAIEAAKWKEKMDLEKVAKLEARVQELEVALKKKG
jgi:hypothetical protein